jgi:transcriptional regulator with XRE-family HTH domain
MLRLKDLRMKKDKTQEDTAKELNIGRVTYCRYETGEREPDLETLQKIAQYFNVTTDYLLGIEPPQVAPINPFQNDIDQLSPENQEELRKYMELLKIKQMTENNRQKEEYANDMDGTGR